MWWNYVHFISFVIINKILIERHLIMIVLIIVISNIIIFLIIYANMKLYSIIIEVIILARPDPFLGRVLGRNFGPPLFFLALGKPKTTF